MHPPPAPPQAQPLRVVEIGMGQIGVIRKLNYEIFQEQRIINTFRRSDLLLLVAYVGETPVGFKVGYRESRRVFYSAKGGVLPAYRRHGIARLLLDEMLTRIRAKGYQVFAYDTFPNRHPGMAVMGLSLGFRLAHADYNAAYQDYRLRFELEL